MKIKISAILLIAIFAAFFFTGCRRTTPHDAYIPCKMLGYFSDLYDYYWYGNSIFYINVTLDTARTITSIRANISGSNTAIAAVYDGATNAKIVSSSQKSVSKGWNTFSIPPTMLAAGTYRLAVLMYNNSESGIRVEDSAGTMYRVGNVFPNVPLTLSGGTSDNSMLLIYADYCP